MMNRIEGRTDTAQAARTPWRHRMRLFRACLWLIRQAVLEETMSFCNFCGETVIMLALWHFALCHDVEVYDRWFRAARRYLCRHIDVEELTSCLWPSNVRQEPPLNGIAEALASPHVYTAVMCATAILAVHLLRWYRSVPLVSPACHLVALRDAHSSCPHFDLSQETIKAIDPHFLVVHEWAGLREPA
ncbi:hypothetical protein OH77DRAFT_1042355 [Trametes cingulata]|nr:hypothetical protein OH77DRAFT_1042355 [Trametes cingulata]